MIRVNSSKILENFTIEDGYRLGGYLQLGSDSFCVGKSSTEVVLYKNNNRLWNKTFTGTDDTFYTEFFTDNSFLYLVIRSARNFSKLICVSFNSNEMIEYKELENTIIVPAGTYAFNTNQGIAIATQDEIYLCANGHFTLFLDYSDLEYTPSGYNYVERRPFYLNDEYLYVLYTFLPEGVTLGYRCILIKFKRSDKTYTELGDLSNEDSTILRMFGKCFLSGFGNTIIYTLETNNTFVTYDLSTDTQGTIASGIDENYIYGAGTSPDKIYINSNNSPYNIYVSQVEDVEGYPINIVDTGNNVFTLHNVDMSTGAIGEANPDVFKNIYGTINMVALVKQNQGSYLVGLILGDGSSASDYIYGGIVYDNSSVEIASITINGQNYQYDNEQNMVSAMVSISEATNIYINTNGTTTTYHIRFLNYDGSILQEIDVNENETPSYTADTPQRTGYTFTGWTPSLSPATHDQDYTATFVINKYTIRFLQDGQVLATKQVEYNKLPVYDGETPQKEGYRFDKWSPDIKVATQDQDYVALFVRQYVIRFLNYDNSVLQSSKIDENTMPEFSGVEPTREHYNFIGWTPEIAIATQDQDYIATFEAMKYQIRFLNGTVVLQDTMVSYGEIPTYTGNEPTKEGHTFIGWSPTIYAVNKNQDYQATFSINTYLITFASEDGIPLETKEVEYGETPEYTGEEPTKEGYVFIGWTPTPYPANKNQTYTPRFRINSFTIRFLGENDEVLQEETLEYGATPVYKGATPTKEHYDFAGWTPEIYPVNRNQDYKVKFTAHYYTITLLNEDGSLFMTVKALFGDPLDSLPTPEPEQEGYVFDKWLPDIQAVSGDATYTASFRIKTFTIRFLNYDGSVLQSEVLEYGATPVYKEDTPIKVGSTFLGWKPDIYSVNKDQDYTAQFSVATHNLVFKANGETLWQITYQGELTKIEVNTLVNLTLSFTDNKGQSSKQITSFENTTNISGFTINGQNYSVNKAHNVSYDSDIEANLTFYSTQHYRIRWNVDGIFQNEYSQIVESGTIPTYTGPTPSKEGHTFLGWSPAPYPADKNQDYTAILRSNDAFTITVRDSENRELNQVPDNNHDFGSDLIISKLRFKQSRIIPYGQMISVFFNENAVADLLVSYDTEYDVKVNSVAIGGITHIVSSDDDEMNLTIPLQSSFEMIFYTKPTYHIRFLDEDGTLLYQTYVGLNETPRYVGKLPSKDENYVFVGWTPSLAPATQDQDYTAVYEWSGLKITSITNALDIPITNELPLLIHNKEVGAAVNKVSVRSGIGDVEITFYFAKNHVDGTQYSEKFTLTYDRNYLTQNNLNLPYTEEAVIDGNTIAADGEKHDIEFAAGASISIEIHNRKTYLTRFLNYDNAILYSTLTVDGETPVYVGDTPTRENYIFIGWSPTPYPANKNQDYIARFNVAFEIMYKSANGTLKSYNAVKMVYKDGTNKIFTKARFDKKENN